MTNPVTNARRALRVAIAATGIVTGLWLATGTALAQGTPCYPPSNTCVGGTTTFTVSDQTPNKGENVTLTAPSGTLDANSGYTVTIQSTERELGKFTATSTGAVQATVQIPTDIESGSHTLFVKGTKNGLPVTLSRAISVQGATGASTGSESSSGGALPRTGVYIIPIAIAGLALVGIGFAMKRSSSGKARQG